MRAAILALALAAGCSTFTDTADVIDSVAGRQAVLVALGNVNPDRYGGWDGECPGSDVDMANAKRYFPAMGSVPVAVLWNEKATSFRILSAWSAAVAAVAAHGGGVVDIYYSGHGGQERDLDGDEADGLDETLCAWDGQITDDIVGAFLSGVPETVQVNFWTDCCNSGSNYRPAFSVREIMRARQTRGRQPIVCRVAHLGGCRDGAASLGSYAGGELSNAVWKTLRKGMSWKALRDACDAVMPQKQVPVVEFVNMTGEEAVW